MNNNQNLNGVTGNQQVPVQPTQPMPQQVPVQQAQPVQQVQQPVQQAQAVPPQQVQTQTSDQIQQELENLRVKAVKKQNMIIVIGIIIYLTIGFLVFQKTGDITLPLFGAFFATAIIVIICNVIKEKTQFIKAYKDKVVVATLKTIFTDIHFDMEKGIPESVIANTDMMMMGNIYYSNDYFYGKYKDIQFQCSDVTIQYEYTDSDGDTHTTTYFDGQWYIFEFNKQFKGSFQVCEKSFHYSKRQGGLFSKKEKDEKIEMEDQEFNKQFKVFGTDAHSVFYVLTPQTMERIKSINSQIKGDLLFCFKDNLLHVGVYNGKDLFEPRLRKKVDIERDTVTTKNEINAILQFVDILHLDNDLFK